MQKKIILISFIFFCSCNHLPEAIGKENEIIIITSPEDRVFVEYQINELFSLSINTPQPETEFSLIFKNPWELENVNKYANLIIASLDFPQDSTGDLLMDRLIDKTNKNEPLFILPDLYAKNQIVCAIHTLDAIAMENEIKTSSEWILSEFRNMLIERIELDLFKNGKNISLSDKVRKMFGYTLHLQPDFTTIKSDSLKPFIWMGRGYPYRWITIHISEKDKYSDTINAWKELSKEYSEIMPDVKIGKYFRKSEVLEYHNKKSKIMRGIYEHIESESGGPFFVYIFDTESMNEVILVSGFVNYPGHEKILLLKQLEIIASTLH